MALILWMMLNALNYTDGDAVFKGQTYVMEDLLLFHRSYFQKIFNHCGFGGWLNSAHVVLM